MQLTWQTWLTFFILSLVMGVNNIYSTLLTGWGDGGSIVAVILCLLFLSKSQRNIINYNLGQTMASAGGSVGFAVAIMASIYYLEASQGRVWSPSLIDLSLFVMGLAIMGVLLAVPLRRFIVHWYFPSAVACATILRAVTSEDLSHRKRASRIMGLSGLFSAIITFPTKVALTPGATPLLQDWSLGANLRISFDPLLYGIGIIVGHRVGISMLLGGLASALYLTPYFESLHGDAGESIRWIAVGLMTLPAFSSVIFAFIFKHERSLPPGFAEHSDRNRFTRRQWFLTALLFIGAMTLVTVEMERLFSVPWKYVFLAVAIAAPMCFALGKVASETDINPVRLLATMLLLVFCLFEKHSPIPLLAIGVVGATFAAIAVDLFYDLRTGYLVRANPKHQIVMQILGVIPVAFVSVAFLDLLATRFGLGEGQYFPAPGAVVWASIAEAFSGGFQEFSDDIWVLIGISSAVGVLLTFLENWSRIRPFVPSTFAMGIAFLLPFDMAAAIFLGSLIRSVAVIYARGRGEEVLKKTEEGAFKAGSAIFAASSIAGIIAVILISLGVVYLPN